uniref:WBP2 N-terminal like n=1 Tax=Ursus maritimus TaxID=29073 RepID=A0A452V4A4_URSMA
IYLNQNKTKTKKTSLPFVLTQCQDVELSFLQQPEGSSYFSGTKKGTLFLTSYRVIFVTSHTVSDPMFSFMMPFDLMSNCTIEQPVFTPNFIKGIIQAAPNGGWEGQATFKLAFRKGGAIEFAQLMMKAASAGYPFVVYGPPQVGYGPAQAGYGPSQVAYGPSSGVYGTPQVGYGPPQAGYGPPPGGYRLPPGGYGTPPAGYGPLPAGNEALPATNETPPAANEALPPGYEVPPAGNRAGSSKFMVAQPAVYEPSLPPASSSEAHPPSFRNNL